MYVFQMNNGRWQVDALTSAPRAVRRIAATAPSFETKAEAEAWKTDADRRAWELAL